jgi:hypothetical protein
LSKKELKIYEIASAVTDAVANNARPSWNTTHRPRDVLNQLHKILASYRGGNKTLISMLSNKIAGIQNGPQMLVKPSSRIEELDDQWLSESTTSPDSMYNTTLDNMPRLQVFQPSSQEAFGNENAAAVDEVQDSFRPSFPMAQQSLPQFTDLSWASITATNGSSSVSPSMDLYEQLQNFGGSFSDVESSGTLDRFLSTSDLWDNPIPRGVNLGNSNIY